MRVDVELKANVSEMSSLSISRVDVMNDCTSLNRWLTNVLCRKRAETNCVVTNVVV
jgi:hypothetical protein